MATNEEKVAACESKIHYEFGNKLLCLEALQASGQVLQWQGKIVRIEKNDRLAVLGEVAAKAHLCKRWFDTTCSKGQWSQIEQAVLTNSNYSAVGNKHGLDVCTILNPGTTSVSQKTMATIVEAVLGAVFVDGGAVALGSVLETLGLTHELLKVAGREEASRAPARLPSCSVFKELLFHVMVAGSPAIARSSSSLVSQAMTPVSCIWSFSATKLQGWVAGDPGTL